MARPGIDHDFATLPGARNARFERAHVAERNELVLVAVDAQHRASKRRQCRQHVAGLALEIRAFGFVQDAVRVRDQTIERDAGRDSPQRAGGVQRIATAHAEPRDPDRSAGGRGMRGESIARVLQGSKNRDVVEGTHPARGILDHRLAVVQTHRQRREAFGGEALRELAIEGSQPEDVVHEEDPGMRTLVGRGEKAFGELFGSHRARVYSRAMSVRPRALQRSFDAELAVALAAAHEAGGVLLRHYRNGTEHWEKSEDNPVTLADLESDRVITRRLRQACPGDGILSEETASVPGRGARRRTWIVDPMDGTKEFVARIPEFAVSIALVEDGEPVVGVVLNPAAGRVVAGARGRGVWQAPWTGGGFGATARAHVSTVRMLTQACVIASRTEISRGRFDPYAGWFGELRAVGSIAWKLACVACGDGDLNVSVAPKNEWDVCAGDLLVREAGGIYVDFDGRPRRYDQQDPLIERFMAAGPRALVDAFCQREHQRVASAE